MLAFYVVPGPRSGLNIPISIQTAYLRGFAERAGLAFSLPRCEAFRLRNSPVFWKIVADRDVTLIVLPTLAYLPPSDQPHNFTGAFNDRDVRVTGALEGLTMGLEEGLRWVSASSIPRKKNES